MDLAIELVRALTSWPVIFALMATVVFRPQVSAVLAEIPKHLPRLRKAGPTGFELDETKQVTGAGPGEIRLEAVPPPPSPFESVRLLEETVWTDLKAIPVSERESALVRALSTTYAVRGHEWEYNRIFDSQLVALRRLNTLEFVKVADARQFLETYTAERGFPPDHFDFERWLLFLTTTRVVSVSSDQVRITPFGRDFLTYIVQAGLPELKGVN